MHLHDVERVLADANASRIRPTYVGAQSATEAVYLAAFEAEERRREQRKAAGDPEEDYTGWLASRRAVYWRLLTADGVRT